MRKAVVMRLIHSVVFGAGQMLPLCSSEVLDPPGPEDAGSAKQSRGKGDDDISDSDHVLHRQRRADLKKIHIYSDTGRGIGQEGALAVLHAIIDRHQHRAAFDSLKMLVTSIDSHQPTMVILREMATGMLCTIDTTNSDTRVSISLSSASVLPCAG